MSTTGSTLLCLNCGTTENDSPLLHLQYKSQKLWICSQCLPTLIHAPQKLVGKLESAEHIKPSAHKH
jgi:hypothetical protein